MHRDSLSGCSEHYSNPYDTRTYPIRKTEAAEKAFKPVGRDILDLRRERLEEEAKERLRLLRFGPEKLQLITYAKYFFLAVALPPYFLFYGLPKGLMTLGGASFLWVTEKGEKIFDFVAALSLWVTENVQKQKNKIMEVVAGGWEAWTNLYHKGRQSLESHVFPPFAKLNSYIISLRKNLSSEVERLTQWIFLKRQNLENFFKREVKRGEEFWRQLYEPINQWVESLHNRAQKEFKKITEKMKDLANRIYEKIDEKTLALASTISKEYIQPVIQWMTPPVERVIYLSQRELERVKELSIVIKEAVSREIDKWKQKAQEVSRKAVDASLWMLQQPLLWIPFPIKQWLEGKKKQFSKGAKRGKEFWNRSKKRVVEASIVIYTAIRHYWERWVRPVFEFLLNKLVLLFQKVITILINLKDKLLNGIKASFTFIYQFPLKVFYGIFKSFRLFLIFSFIIPRLMILLLKEAVTECAITLRRFSR